MHVAPVALSGAPRVCVCWFLCVYFSVRELDWQTGFVALLQAVPPSCVCVCACVRADLSVASRLSVLHLHHTGTHAIHGSESGAAADIIHSPWGSCVPCYFKSICLCIRWISAEYIKSSARTVSRVWKQQCIVGQREEPAVHTKATEVTGKWG